MLDSLSQLRAHPRVVLGFTASLFGLHLLGWTVFGLGDGVGNAVFAVFLYLIGIVLYAISLIWLIDGLTRAGLDLSRGLAPQASSLFRWHGACSWHITRGVLRLTAALSLIVLISFLGWSFLLLVAQPLAPLPLVIGVVLGGGLALSQLFNACLVVAEGLGATKAFRAGFVLLEHQGPGLIALAGVLLAITGLPFALGLLGELLWDGSGLLITCVVVVPSLCLMATTVTNSYVQWRRIRRGAR
ncbi:hypothetical protein MY494_11070 [Synechococcus sp. A10-1-5-1]|uniref:hypothetical protein n=1 Tax=Synechococcus sp. A10-1-5-1 TaxID=2936507 RepID=UPI002000C3AE|nr:hypothetical protein [Synechococcus sp. A10-1-5-1]UPM49851.1 hypothetical protein MY494_11070 [Synechococcus sp. A10-1-5-1]